MLGNVWEWCQDWANQENKYKMLHGGSWNLGSSSCRCAYCLYYTPNYMHLYIGFRLVVVP